MNIYNIGPLTMEYVFRRAGLENLANMQAVMDAVEGALQAIEQFSYEDGLKDGLDAAGPEV